MSDLSVVVPCFNEEGNLQVLYDRICEIGTKENVSLELIFVDDHSRDGTFNVAAQLSKSDPRVRAIRFEKLRIAYCLHLRVRAQHRRCRCPDRGYLQDPPRLLLNC